MAFAARLASFTLLLTTVAVPIAHAQSRSAAMAVQVQVLPTCGVSVQQANDTSRAQLSCAGTPPRAVRMKVAGSATTVPLVSTGNSRSSAEIDLPGASDRELVTIQF
jgi:hypothetical protein